MNEYVKWRQRMAEIVGRVKSLERANVSVNTERNTKRGTDSEARRQ